jgi:hypothetical protein
LQVDVEILSLGFPHRRQFPSGLPFSFFLVLFLSFVEKIPFHNAL